MPLPTRVEPIAVELVLVIEAGEREDLPAVAIHTRIEMAQVDRPVTP